MPESLGFLGLRVPEVHEDTGSAVAYEVEVVYVLVELLLEQTPYRAQ